MQNEEPKLLQIHYPNICNSSCLDDYQKPCLGKEFTNDSYLCKSCHDYRECMELHKRWKSLCVKKYIKTNGITVAPKAKVIPFVKKKTSRELLLEELAEFGFK